MYSLYGSRQWGEEGGKKRKRANEERMATCVLLPFLGVPRRLHFLLPQKTEELYKNEKVVQRVHRSPARMV